MAGLDFEKLKKAATDLQARMNRGSGPSLKFWKPADGVNTIRILPPWTAEGTFAGQFYREVHQHWNVSEEASGPVLCPRKTPGASEDGDCPICDFVDQLRNRKGDVDAQELAKNLRAKVAYLMSIVDLKDPSYTAKDVAEWTKERPDTACPFEVGDTKIQCYAATSTIADQVMNLIIVNQLDITDLFSGNNVILTKIPNKDKLKTRYTVAPEIRPTKAPVKEGLEMPDLSRIGKVQSSEDLLKLLGEGPASAFLTRLPSNAGKHTADASWTGDATAVSGDDDDLAAQMKAQLGNS